MATVITKADGPKLVIDPDENLIVGMLNVMRYLKIKSHATLYRWIELYGLPCVKRPDGVWITTMTAIDQWIFLAAEADFENRPMSRGTNTRLEIQIRRLMDRVKDEKRHTENRRLDPHKVLTERTEAVGAKINTILNEDTNASEQ
jgi:hypothetical protein